MISISDDFKSKWLLNIWFERPISPKFTTLASLFIKRSILSSDQLILAIIINGRNKYYLGPVIRDFVKYTFNELTVTFGNLVGSHIAQWNVIELVWILRVLNLFIIGFIAHTHRLQFEVQKLIVVMKSFVWLKVYTLPIPITYISNYISNVQIV